MQQEHGCQLVSAGHACAAYQHRVLRNPPCKRIQMKSGRSFAPKVAM
jgi:hypothetical protein